MAGNDGTKNRHRQPSGTWIKKHKRLAIYELDGMKCLICDCDLSDVNEEERTLDHVEPKASHDLPKPNDAANLLTACRECNCARQHRSLEEFVGVAKATKLRKHARERASKVREVARQIRANRG